MMIAPAHHVQENNTTADWYHQHLSGVAAAATATASDQTTGT